MADAFSDREKGFEAKYKLDEENRFKMDARRNNLLGEWLAFQFGLTGDAVAEYAKEVVISDLDEPGQEDVVRKVLADIEKKGSDITEADVRAKMSEFEGVAVEQTQSSK
ncbi:MAG: DUF1476 domain-containing protein [Rhodospirillales bacterium]|nr:DUF1476 domain-containing protein [Rhodospirillales bacterium]